MYFMAVTDSLADVPPTPPEAGLGPTLDPVDLYISPKKVAVFSTRYRLSAVKLPLQILPAPNI